MKFFSVIVFLCLILFPLLGIAQNSVPLLDRKLSVNFANVPLNKALFTLSEMAEFNLSYNANILPSGSVVNYKVENKKLSEILATIIPSEIIVKTSGNNVILLKKSPKELKKKDIVIEGEVIDMRSGKPVDGATVLDIYGSQSVLSDSVGNFKLQLTHKQVDLVFSVSKAGYQDSSFILMPESQKVIFYLQYIEPPKKVEFTKLETNPIKPIEAYTLSKLIIPELLILHSENISGYIKRKFQLSLTPGVSTNLKIVGTIKNQISINLIGGYNYGVSIFEIGGAFNINRTDVEGFQIAGVSNLVGGDLSGLQVAGVINKTKGKQKGVQIAGFGNFNTSDFYGLQAAAAANLAKNLKGVQIASGVNLADTLSGFQVSTLYNKSTYLEGFQLSAGLNVCDTLNGVQVGIINRARQQNGFQFGIININNSSKGISIGIINLVKDKKFPRLLFCIK
jgi:hypothetical protein